MGEAQKMEIPITEESFVDELKPGARLMYGQYTIERFLNAGGFGITYLAKDSLDRKVVIKECFPGAFCRRSNAIVQARSRAHQSELKSIVRLFVQEARNLAKMNHPNIVGVHQVFEENDTAYMALDFVEGRDLLDTLEDPDHDLTPKQIKSILKDVLGAVEFTHQQGVLHRDISPDNILIDANLRPVLIDFGAAREQASKSSRVLSALRVVKDGYSPQEFYIAGSDQSPSSDLYSLGATFYHLIANEAPPNSQARLAAIASGTEDPYQPLVSRIEGYDKSFLSAIDTALQVLPKNRLQSAKAWLDMIDGKTPRPVGATPGNVTPLRPVVTKKLDVKADEPAPAKSKMPVLMASVAAIALIGVAVVMQTGLFGGSTEPVEIAVAAATPAVVETAADVVAQTPTEATALVDTIAVLPQVSQDLPTARANRTTAALTVTEPPAIVPLPAEVSTNPPILAGHANAAVDADIAPSGITLPAGQLDTVDVALAMAGPIEAVLPGKEISAVPVSVGEVQNATDVMSAWSVVLPFEPSATNAKAVGKIADVAPVWLREGLEIASVNGVPVEDFGQINSALRQSANPNDSGQIAIRFGIVDAAGNVAEETATLPIVQETALLNGVQFHSEMVEGVWQTSVVSAPGTSAGDLEVGDVLIAYIPTSEKIDERTSIEDIIAREIGNGTASFSFAVSRDGAMWVASLNYAAGVKG